MWSQCRLWSLAGKNATTVPWVLQIEFLANVESLLEVATYCQLSLNQQPA